MSKEYFAFTGKIPFEGKESKNVMAFHYYEPERVVMGKKMKDWLKFGGTRLVAPAPTSLAVRRVLMSGIRLQMLSSVPRTRWMPASRL